jgi:hypothetical protein
MRRSRFGNCSRAVPAKSPRSPPTVKFAPVARDQDGADIRAFGNLRRGLGEVSGHALVDRIAHVRTVQAQCGDATFEIQ